MTTVGGGSVSVWFLVGGINEQTAIALVGSVVLLGVGGLILYKGTKGAIARTRRLFDTVPFDPSDTYNPADPVAVTGTVKQAEELLTAPLSNEPCVAYEQSEQEYRYSYKYDKDHRRRKKRQDDEDWNEREWTWETVDTETNRVPFQVDTDDGTVAVDPDGASIDPPFEKEEKPGFWTKTKYQMHPLTETQGTQSILKFLGHFYKLLGPGEAPDPLTREIVSHLDPGEEVLVVGSITEQNDSNSPGTTVEETDGTEIYEITTQSLSRLRLGAIMNIFLGSLLGLLFIVGGVIVLMVGVTGLIA